MNQGTHVLSVAAKVLDSVDESEIIEAAEILCVANPAVITGVGKSFLVGQRAAATMRSFGLSVFAESATDLLHGGLGCRPPVMIALSHSGTTAEVLEAVAEQRVLIAITSDGASPLADAAHTLVTYGTFVEPMAAHCLPIIACHVQAAILDAIALRVSARRHLTPDTVARWHPGGDIGRRLTGG